MTVLTPSQPFDPLTQTLKKNECLRLQKGKLYVEDKAVRRGKCWLIRIFTRHQYKQSRILSTISLLAERAMQREVSLSNSKNLLDNHTILMNKATQHNIKYSDKSLITRFFLGKRLIDINAFSPTQAHLSHYVQNLSTETDAHKRSNEEFFKDVVEQEGAIIDIWSDDGDEDSACDSCSIGNTGFIYADSILEKLGMNYTVNHNPKAFDLLFTAMDLKTVGQWKAKGLTTQARINKYFEVHRQTLSDAILNNGAAASILARLPPSD